MRVKKIISMGMILMLFMISNLDNIERVVGKKNIFGYYEYYGNKEYMGNSIKQREVDKKGFVHTEGTKLKYSNGEEYIIHGMNFGNKMWYNPSEPQTYYNDENSYKELSEMGINTIRYYLNYALLEDDEKPGVYKKSGLDWLDKNVKWASKYGIKIIFNMHIPQGSKPADSWDMPSGSLYIFYGDNANANKNRLTKMWRFLANRYKDNKGVLGYSILNEPCVALEDDDLDKSIKIWEDYAQDLTDEIRKVDKNHIIFVEPTTSVYDIDLQEYCVYDYADSMFVPKDNNVVSEYHFYYPVEFTHQASNSSYEVGSCIYPDKNKLIVGEKEWKDCLFYTKNYKTSTKGFKYVESPLATIKNLDDYNIAYPMFRTVGKSKGWKAYFDNISIKVYNKDKKLVDTIMQYDFNTSVDYKILEGYYDGCAKYCEKGGINNSGCLMMKDKIGEFSVSSASTYKYFKLKKGYSYKVCAYVKVENDTKDSVNVTPTISFEKSNEVYALDKEYLNNKISTFTEFMEKTDNKVPIYMGEFGTFEETYDYGGYKWVEDMLDIMLEKKMNFSYHEYRPAIYTGYDDVSETERNDKMYNLFKDKLTN